MFYNQLHLCWAVLDLPIANRVRETSYIFHHVVVNVTTVFVTSYEEAV